MEALSKLGYIHLAKGSSLKVLFLPGWNTKIDNYRPLLLDLSNHYEVLALSLYGFENTMERAYSMEDYVTDVRKTIEELNYKPDLIIGYSFGGKVATKLNLLDTPLLLIAPSSFRPLLRYRLKVKLKVTNFKMRKWLFKHNIVKSLEGYGSLDYKNSSGYVRETFLKVKDEYVDSHDIEKYRQVNVIGYIDDESVSIKTLRTRTKRHNNITLYESGGDHYQLFYDTYLITLVVERILTC